MASCFISRIDSEVNDRLPAALQNRLGVASAGVAYVEYRRLLESERWRRLAEAGAFPQRLVWASTATKDPSMPDTYYVTALAAEGTVNTMPESTMLAFAPSGVLDGVLSPDGHDARRYLARGAEHDVDMGGPNTGVFLQVAPEGGEDIPIPGERFSFANLLSAQAAGDLQALLERGRRAGRVTLADLRQVIRAGSTEQDDALVARSS